MTSNILRIKNFPVAYSADDVQNFLADYGAVTIKYIKSKVKSYNAAFASFTSPESAQQTMTLLHQMQVEDSHLCVEYAHPSTNRDLNLTNVTISSKFETREDKIYDQYVEKLTSWLTDTNLKIPIPFHLNYHYPPPTPEILQNIVTVLSQTPRFYVQVLHLMNKMNLPCPFETEMLDETVEMEESESEVESELSCDDENVKEIIPQTKKKAKTKIKRPKFVKPIKSERKTRKILFEEVFEDPKKLTEALKKPKIDTSSKVHDDIVTEKSADGGFGYIIPIHKPPPEDVVSEEESEEDVADKRDEREEERLEREKIKCISKKALADKRISERDRSVLPVFKNYAEGTPTCRLYIKNLAKQTTEEDLRFIYNRFINKSTQSSVLYDVRLMQEGRMKGQAFVTLDSVTKAKEALAETNGYILHEKPMVVQFARSNNN